MSILTRFLGWAEPSSSSSLSEESSFHTPRDFDPELDDDAASSASDEISADTSKKLLPRKSPRSESPRYERGRIEKKADIEDITKAVAKLTLSDAAATSPSLTSAQSPLSTSAGRRHAFSQGRKTPPLDLGAVLNKSAYEQLTPRQRSEFKDAIHAKDDDSEEKDQSRIGSPSPRTPTSSNLSKQSITRILATTEELDQQRRDKELLDTIEQFGNHSVKANIMFCTEGIIAPEHLFKIIGNRINVRMQAKSADDIKRVTQLLVFCIAWLENNEGTKLVQKVAESLKTIIQTTKTSGFVYLQAQSASLEKNLKTALEKKPAQAITVPAVSFGKSSFETYLDTVASGKAKDYKKRARELAEDIFHMQIDLFFAISKDHLVQKWPTSSTLGAPINRFSDISNIVFEYIINKIIFQPEPFGRRNLMKFFLEVGHTSLLLEDHQTASIIFTILSNPVFNMLPTTCKKVHKHKHYTKLYELFNGDRQFESLKKRVAELEKDQKPYIPHLSVKVNECIVKEANHPGVVEKEDADPQYNLEKLAALREQASQFPALQGRFHEISENFSKPHTDFVDKHVKNISAFSTKESDANSTLRKLHAQRYKEQDK
jgi:hypothetical protein